MSTLNWVLEHQQIAPEILLEMCYFPVIIFIINFSININAGGVRIHFLLHFHRLEYVHLKSLTLLICATLLSIRGVCNGLSTNLRCTLTALDLIKLHEKETQSVYSKKIIQQWSNEKSNFYQVCPKEMLNKLKQPLSNKAVHGKAV